MATGKIANLSVGVGVDAAEFTNGLSKAEVQAKAWVDRMTKQATVAGAAIGVALAAGVGEFVSRLNESADAIDAFNDLRDATSASIENISALDDVARRTGASFSTVESILIKFNKVLGEAGDNSAGDAIKALGLNVEELKRQDPAEALRQTAVALKGFADEATKSRYIQELFGKSVKEAAPYLNDLAEQTALVAKTTAADAQAAEDYNKALFRFKAAATDFERSVTSAVLPSLNEAISRFNDAREAYGSFWEAYKDQVLRGSDNPFSSTTERISETREELAKLQKELQATGSSGMSADGVTTNRQRSAALQEEIDLLQKRERLYLARQQRELPQASYSNEGRVQTSAQPVLPDLEVLEKQRKEREKAEKEAAAAREKAASEAAAAVARAQEGARRYIDHLDKQIAKVRELTAEERVVDDILKGRVKFNDAAQAGRALDMAEQIDQAKRLAEQYDFEGEGLRMLDEQRKASFEEAARLYEDTRTPLERYRAELARLVQLQTEAPVSADTMSRAVEAASQRYQAALEQANKANDAMSEFAKQAERNIQDALGQTLEDSLSGRFENIGQMWLQLLQRMAAQAFAARLNDALFGNGSNVGSIIKGIFGTASSTGMTYGSGDVYAGIDGTDFLGSFANGLDRVPRDGLAMIHKDERIVPAKYNPANGGQGGGTHFDFSGASYSFGAGVDAARVRAEVEAGNARLEAKIRRSESQRRAYA
ncbi:MAG TPA: hypothetical protein VM686_28705 [Polyangiaceae bacterium]|nr:hypothetical protein [Polyangiaceae bacterium]